MTPHDFTAGAKVVKPADVAREGRFVALTATGCVLYHPVRPPVYRGVFRAASA